MPTSNLYIYVCVCVCVCVYIYTYIYVCVCIYIYIYVCVCVCVCVYITIIKSILYYIKQGSRVRPIWLHVRPNFSRVRLTKIPGRTGASSHSRKEKKSIRDSETLWFNKRHPR